MTEDALLAEVIYYFAEDGWSLAYQTRPLSQGAIAGVDAILLKQDPWRFVFIDAKGSTHDSIKRSNNFTNALGAILKRIRFERGYMGFEAKKYFNSTKGMTRNEVIETIKKYAVHRNSQYILAFDRDMEQTIKSSFDPALASLLHISVLFVSESEVTFFRW